MNVTGTVKWFDNRKGFGFLLTDGIEEDIFVHYSQVMGEGFKCLHDGEKVDFDLVQGDKGYHAHHVTKHVPCAGGAHNSAIDEPSLSRV